MTMKVLPDQCDQEYSDLVQSMFKDTDQCIAQLVKHANECADKFSSSGDLSLHNVVATVEKDSVQKSMTPCENIAESSFTLSNTNKIKLAALRNVCRVLLRAPHKLIAYSRGQL